MARDTFGGGSDQVGTTPDVGGQPVTNVGTPTNSSDAATKGYVDTADAAEVTARNAAITANGSSGRELAYAEQLTSLTSQGNTNYTTGLSLTIPDFVVAGRPVYAVILADIQFAGTNTVSIALTLADNTVVAEKTFYTSTSFGQMGCILRKRLTTPGTYSAYEVHAKTSASTYGLIGTTGNPAVQVLIEEK